MDLVRGFVGFVFGAIVVAGLHFSGMLDGPSHWWSRHNGIGTVAPEDDGHSRYTIHAIYQSQGGDDCQPQYEFHNLTNRNVTFATNWDDQAAPSLQGQPPPSNGQPISMQPSNAGSPPNYPPQNNGPQNYGSQDYDRQDDDGDDQNYASRGNGGDNYNGDQDDDQYPGGGQGSACGTGVIQIFVDRKK